MTDANALTKQARMLGNIETDALALRWLRACASTLADWGGAEAKAALSTLPKELLSGGGTRGRSLAKAQEAADGSGATALYGELAHRTRQADPGKAAQMGPPVIGLLKRELGTEEVGRLLAALPADVAGEVRDATTQAPYRYFLIPQSYARPSKVRT